VAHYHSVQILNIVLTTSKTNTPRLKTKDYIALLIRTNSGVHVFSSVCQVRYV